MVFMYSFFLGQFGHLNILKSKCMGIQNWCFMNVGSIIIKHLLNSSPDIINAVMVGDTMTDVNGAKENNIPTVAVLWGYGDKAEISNFAYAVAGTTDELYEILKQ